MTGEQARGAGPASAIPEAALELLVTRGFDATSVDELAAAAGISRSTFFRRFGSKEDMVFADQESVLVRVAEALATGHATPPESVAAAALAVFDHHTARPHASRLRYELLQAVPALRDRELVSTHRYEAMFRTWLASPEASGTSGHAGSETAAVAYAAAVVAVHNAFLRRWLRSPEPAVRHELEMELHALGRLFAPSLAPPAAEAPNGMLADNRAPHSPAIPAHIGTHGNAGHGIDPVASGRVVVAVADASADADAILAAVREALELRGH